MEPLHVFSAITGGGLIVSSVMLARLGRRANDAFLRSLSLACLLFAMTQFANAVPGWLRGDQGWTYLPRLAGFLIILRQIVKLKLAL